jgi:glycosyltransferase involved in cell wall biosynthesis
LDAFPIIKEKIPNLQFLIVGDSHLLPEMKRKARKYNGDIIFTGWINYDEIQDYFAALDVGIYPVGKNVYFDSACPIKILEYTAANKPVVSTDLKELHNLNFPNVIFAEPNPKDFSEKIVMALNTNVEYPDLKEHDWDVLTRKLEKILVSVVKEKR